MKTILVVEDEIDLLYALTDELRKNNYRIISADDGSKAMEMARFEIPDFILLDIKIPEIDGWTVLEKLKEMPQTKGIPVVVLSNLSDRASETRAFDLGAMDYWRKTETGVGEIASGIKRFLK